ncbi:MAG: pyridoxal-dependent decarboxylase [Planctomycetota bacterium]|nr:pyridoxal-dependent decarboxylase [Planctomycetota bacterium]
MLGNEEWAPHQGLEKAYDPETFRELGHRLIDRVADYLKRARARELPVLDMPEPGAMMEAWPSEFPDRGDGQIVERLQRFIEQANHLHNPGFVGHQVSAPLPAAVLCDMIGSLLNNGMAVYEMGPSQTAAELHVVRFLADRIGFDGDSGGVLTHGGSIGNLTALLAARQARAGQDVWAQGQQENYAVLASAQNHYSVARAVRIMGWGEGGIEPVEVDGDFRMRPECLAAAKERAERSGRKVLAVVASDCTTSTGSFDPIEAIADFCGVHGLWLHVDAAHGGTALLHSNHRGLLAGIHRADSVVWDLHKMMLMPALITGVVFRENRRSYEAFAQEASYLFEGDDPEKEWFNVGLRTMECTKRALGTTAYVLLQAFGTELFADYFDRALALTRSFAEMVRSSADFELGLEPRCNIVCFRYVGRECADRNAQQARIRNQVLKAGNFYLVQTRLGQSLYLRLTLIQPFTTPQMLAELLEEIRSAAQE